VGRFAITYETFLPDSVYQELSESANFLMELFKKLNINIFETWRLHVKNIKIQNNYTRSPVKSSQLTSVVNKASLQTAQVHKYYY